MKSIASANRETVGMTTGVPILSSYIRYEKRLKSTPIKKMHPGTPSN